MSIIIIIIIIKNTISMANNKTERMVNNKTDFLE